MVQVIKGSDHTLWCHTYDDKVYLFDTQRERFEDEMCIRDRHNTLQNAQIALKRAMFSLASFLNLDKNTVIELDIPVRPTGKMIPVDDALMRACLLYTSISNKVLKEALKVSCDPMILNIIGKPMDSTHKPIFRTIIVLHFLFIFPDNI